MEAVPTQAWPAGSARRERAATRGYRSITVAVLRSTRTAGVHSSETSAATGRTSRAACGFEQCARRASAAPGPTCAAACCARFRCALGCDKLGALWAEPLLVLLWRFREAHAFVVEPFVLALIIVACHHLPMRGLLAVAVQWLVCPQLMPCAVQQAERNAG